MKPQQLGNLLSIAPTTLRRWAREYGEFLSPAGRGNDGAYRTYDERDGRIVAWIATMRAQNIAPADIIATLRAAQSSDWRNLPPLPGGMAGEPVALVPREAAEERVWALEQRYELQLETLTKERDALESRLNRADAEIDKLRGQLSEANQQIVEMSKELTSMAKENRQRRDTEK